MTGPELEKRILFATERLLIPALTPSIEYPALFPVRNVKEKFVTAPV
jgi:hypothetical protein